MSSNIADDEGQRSCSYYVIRKKRFCHMLVAKGQKYCGQHMVEETNPDDGLKRIPCPLDNKHSCYEHRLKQHLATCNARERNDCPYKTKNINLGPIVTEPQKCRLSDITDNDLLRVIERIRKVHAEHVSLEADILQHPSLVEELLTPWYSLTVTRHLQQNSSIISQIAKCHGFNKPTCYIEFGAGKGQLTKCLIAATDDASQSTYLLVDRGAQRHKYDTKLRYNESLKIGRLRLDIQHLNLDNVDYLGEYKDVVACGKHLCGAATDLTLRCLTGCSGIEGKVAAIVIALCCHHRCTWQSYTGKQFFEDVCLSPEDFYCILGITSWAVCSAKPANSNSPDDSKDNLYDEVTHGSTTTTTESQDLYDEVTHGSTTTTESQDQTDTTQQNENRYIRLGLSIELREVIGREAKQILDYGRLKFLNTVGFNVRLIEYVSKDMTLENIAIVAIPKK